MSISLTDLEFLVSDGGKGLLGQLEQEDLSDGNILRLITTLRKSYAGTQVNAALSVARLRIKAVDKFGDDALRMFFTDDALQQASDPLIRTYRSQVIQGRQVLDVCCGIGADALAFSTTNVRVLGLDIDPVRMTMAHLNALALGLDNAYFEVSDVREGIPGGFDMIFYDPARRDERGRRIYHVEHYIPPLSLMRQWRAEHIATKLSPGVDLGQLGDYSGQLEFISVKGELKEAVLGLGEGQSVIATLLTAAGGYHWWREFEPDNVPVSEPQGWLVEPDPSLIRAGLVKDVAQEFNGSLLDETIAYFTTFEKPDSPWVRSWQILDWMPFNLKKLRAYLRARNTGVVTVKKRGSPLTPEELISRLRLKGDESCTLVLSKHDGKPIVIVCADYVVESGG